MAASPGCSFFLGLDLASLLLDNGPSCRFCSFPGGCSALLCLGGAPSSGQGSSPPGQSDGSAPPLESYSPGPSETGGTCLGSPTCGCSAGPAGSHASEVGLAALLTHPPKVSLAPEKGPSSGKRPLAPDPSQADPSLMLSAPPQRQHPAPMGPNPGQSSRSQPLHPSSSRSSRPYPPIDSVGRPCNLDRGEYPLGLRINLSQACFVANLSDSLRKLACLGHGKAHLKQQGGG